MYFKLGQLAAMSLLQGGAALRLLSPSVYNYLCGIQPNEIIVEIDEVAEEGIRNLLHKVKH